MWVFIYFAHAISSFLNFWYVAQLIINSLRCAKSWIESLFLWCAGLLISMEPRKSILVLTKWILKEILKGFNYKFWYSVSQIDSIYTYDVLHVYDFCPLLIFQTNTKNFKFSGTHFKFFNYMLVGITWYPDFRTYVYWLFSLSHEQMKLRRICIVSVIYFCQLRA